MLLEEDEEDVELEEGVDLEEEEEEEELLEELLGVLRDELLLELLLLLEGAEELPPKEPLACPQHTQTVHEKRY